MTRIFNLILTLAALTASPLLAQQPIATLRPGDVLVMRLSGMPVEYANDFNLEYTVSQSGTVNVPLIGEVTAGGLTASDLEKVVQNRLLAEKIFTRPTVVINLQANARFVSVGGGVRQPQRMQWTSDLTLTSAIDIAGGLDEFTSKKGIRLIRGGKMEAFDLRQLERNPGSDPKLLPGDQVVAPK